MEPSKPMDINATMNKLRRGSLDSNMGRRDSMDSGASMQDSRPSSFEMGRSVDEARMAVFKANRGKKVWDAQDTTTAFWSA
jgi:hypothetical protein